jgi:hypothetical protein
LRLVTRFVARKMVENNIDVYNYLCGDGGVGGLLHFLNIFVSKLCGMRACNCAPCCAVRLVAVDVCLQMINFNLS